MADFSQRGARAVEKTLSGNRWSHAIQLSLEQRHAKFVLERLNATADGGLTDAENSRGAAEARVISDEQSL